MRMSKFVHFVLMGLVFFCALSPIAAEGKIDGSAPAAVHEGKFSIDVPPGHPKTVSFEKFATLVKERTNGRVSIAVFPSSQLGGELETAEGMRLNSIQMGSITSSVLVSWIPEVQVIDMPFLFRDDAHAAKAINWLANRLAPKFDSQGFHLLGFSINGARQPMSTFPIRSPEDVVGKKMRVIQSPLHIGLWKAVGANPVSIPAPEIYVSLQTRVVDFFDNTPTNYFTMKFSEVAPYYTELSHVYAIASWVVSKKWFDGLTTADQKIVEQTAKEIIPEIHQLLAAQDKASLEKAKEKGATIITGVDKKPWQEKMIPIWKEFGAKIPDGEAMMKAIGEL